MPLVTIKAVEGRTVEQKRALVKDITEAVVKNFKTEPEAVIVDTRNCVPKDERVMCHPPIHILVPIDIPNMTPQTTPNKWRISVTTACSKGPNIMTHCSRKQTNRTTPERTRPRRHFTILFQHLNPTQDEIICQKPKRVTFSRYVECSVDKGDPSWYIIQVSLAQPRGSYSRPSQRYHDHLASHPATVDAPSDAHQ